MALRENYKDFVLDTSKNEKRVYDVVDANGSIVHSNVSLVDKSVYQTNGDNFGAADINATNADVNKSIKSTIVKKIELVDSLPSAGEDGAVYFVYN